MLTEAGKHEDQNAQEDPKKNRVRFEHALSLMSTAPITNGAMSRQMVSNEPVSDLCSKSAKAAIIGSNKH